MSLSNDNSETLCNDLIFEIIENINSVMLKLIHSSYKDDLNNNVNSELNISYNEISETDSPDVIFDCETKKPNTLIQPEIITISSDEEEMDTTTMNNNTYDSNSQDSLPHNLMFEDYDWPVNHPLPSPPKPRRANNRNRRTCKSLKPPRIVANFQVNNLKSCLKSPTVYYPRNAKHVKFNPIGSMTFIPSNYENKQEKYAKTQSLSKTFEEYPYQLTLS